MRRVTLELMRPMSRAATSRLKVNPPLGSPPTLEWRALPELLIDSTYQREVDTPQSQSLIRKIAMYWDWGFASRSPCRAA
jgi:hypothetical protein